MHKYMAQMIEYVQERNAKISDDGGLYEGGTDSSSVRVCLLIQGTC